MSMKKFIVALLFYTPFVSEAICVMPSTSVDNQSEEAYRQCLDNGNFMERMRNQQELLKPQQEKIRRQQEETKLEQEQMRQGQDRRYGY